jgi:phenylalanyl-tRNA synthetase alpha chain
MADLKGTLDSFAKQLFGTKVRTKLHAPLLPVHRAQRGNDVSCFKCGGTGCRVCKGSGWIEILGADGPSERSECGNVDTEKYNRLSLRMGVERIAMLKYEIDDIRLFYENDMRFIQQFK